jgi:hypothetical protein
MARHLKGWTLRRARNCRFSAALNVASYARRALPPGWTQMCLEGTVVLRLRRAGRAAPAEILLAGRWMFGTIAGPRKLP